MSMTPFEFNGEPQFFAIIDFYDSLVFCESDKLYINDVLLDALKRHEICRLCLIVARQFGRNMYDDLNEVVSVLEAMDFDIDQHHFVCIKEDDDSYVAQYLSCYTACLKSIAYQVKGLALVTSNHNLAEALKERHPEYGAVVNLKCVINNVQGVKRQLTRSFYDEMLKPFAKTILIDRLTAYLEWRQSDTRHYFHPRLFPSPWQKSLDEKVLAVGVLIDVLNHVSYAYTLDYADVLRYGRLGQVLDDFAKQGLADALCETEIKGVSAFLKWCHRQSIVAKTIHC